MGRLALVATVLVVAACGDDDGNNPTPPTGTYALVSIAGDAVPVAAGGAAGTTNTIEGGTLNFTAGTMVLALRSVTSGGTTNSTRSNALTVQAGQLCLDGDDCALFTTSGGTLTVQFPAVTPGASAFVPWVFERQ